MKKLMLLGVFALLGACAPGTVPTPEPTFYKASETEIFTAVVQAISSAPALADSSGWSIVTSDSAGGFIRAETSVERCGFLGFGCDDETESLSVIISRDGDRTQVIMQITPEAQLLSSRVRAQLGEKFNRA